MYSIKLNDLLNLDKNSNDFQNGRITFCQPKFMGDYLNNSDPESQNYCDFSFHAYNNGKDGKKKQILHKGDFVIVSVKMNEDNWLLTDIATIEKVVEVGSCDRKIVDRYRKYFGKVIFRMKKLAQGYNFKIRTFLERCEVVEVLSKPYGGKPFPGYSKICINMRELINNIKNTSIGKEWQDKLSAVKGVYCLNNHDEKKVYIGSAYNNKNCLYKRWEDYFNSSHGGNVKLKELFEKNKNNPDYFLENFYFSVLEVFSTTTDDQTIIDREQHWKKVFNSGDERQGYNKN